MKTIKNYQDAKNYLQGKKSRPYANNTRIVMDILDMGHEIITITYHNNPVVNLYPEYTSYSSCGWKTNTTKERINWFLPEGFSLYQEKSVWYIVKHGTSFKYTFADGLTIDLNGNVYNDAPSNEQDTTKATIKAIKQYVDGYIKALLQNEIENPSDADCWYCAMQTTDGENLGDAMKNNDHILSHMEESYFVPSLLVNAEKFSHHMSIMSKDGCARLMQGDSISEWQASIVTRDVKSTLTAYLKHELGIAQ